MAMMGGKGGKGGSKGMFMTWDMLQMMMMGKGMGLKAPIKPGCKVKVTNVPDGAEWQELKDHFAQCGTVEFTNVRGKNGEVRFSTPNMAKKAVNMMNGSALMG